MKLARYGLIESILIHKAFVCNHLYLIHPSGRGTLLLPVLGQPLRIAPGCDIPVAAPLANIDAYMEAARQCAKYPVQPSNWEA